MKKSTAALLLAVVSTLSVWGGGAAYAQAESDFETIHAAVMRNAKFLMMPARDSSFSYSYLAVFDEDAQLDTLLFSPGVEDKVHRQRIAELKQAYRSFDSLNVDLKNVAIFVPVLVRAENGTYSPTGEEWKSDFSVLKPELLQGKHLKYVAPVMVHTSYVICPSILPEPIPQKQLVMPLWRRQLTP